MDSVVIKLVLHVVDCKIQQLPTAQPVIHLMHISMQILNVLIVQLANTVMIIIKPVTIVKIQIVCYAPQMSVYDVIQLNHS